MKEKAGVIWFRCDESITDKEMELLVSDFFKTNVDVIPGGKYHQLDSREEANKLIERLEKALKLSKKLKLKKEDGIVQDETNLVIN